MSAQTLLRSNFYHNHTHAKFSETLNITNVPNNYTLPGHNYLGPGTDVEYNLTHDVIPTDDADFLAMQHDFSYLTAKTVLDIEKADENFVGNDFEGKISSVLLKIKSALGYDQSFINDTSLSQDYIKVLEEDLENIKQAYLSKPVLHT
jgi:hypothetical protein